MAEAPFVWPTEVKYPLESEQEASGSGDEKIWVESTQEEDPILHQEK